MCERRMPAETVSKVSLMSCLSSRKNASKCPSKAINPLAAGSIYIYAYTHPSLPAGSIYIYIYIYAYTHLSLPAGSIYIYARMTVFTCMRNAAYLHNNRSLPCHSLTVHVGTNSHITGCSAKVKWCRRHSSAHAAIIFQP